MDYLENLIFVFKHSAYSLPAAAILFTLGFLYGCCNLAKYTRKLQLAEAEGAELEEKLSGNDTTIATTSTEDEPAKAEAKAEAEAKVAAPLTPIKPVEPPKEKQSKVVGAGSTVGVGSALIGLGALGAKFIGDEKLLVVDEELGLLYKEAPKYTDNLAELEGIDEATAEQLNEAGFYTFKQLETLNDEQRGHFETLFDLPNANWQEWGDSLDWNDSNGLVGLGEVINRSKDDDDD